MKIFKAIVATVAMAIIVCACGVDGHDTKYSYRDAVIIKPAGMSKSTNGFISEDGALVYPIGSAFVGGFTVTNVGLPSFHCRFYQEKYTACPDWREVIPLVLMEGIVFDGIEYADSGECIDRITINGLDESLGLGSNLEIKMKQGKYDGTNELIKDVTFKSFKLATYYDDYNQNKDADINISITTTAGGQILIIFNNDVTPHDGIY